MSDTIKYGEDKPADQPKPVKEFVEPKVEVETPEELTAVHETVETTDIAGKQFDPSEHGVDSVNDYLRLTGDPVERARVLQAERAGKNRKTVGL